MVEYLGWFSSPVQVVDGRVNVIRNVSHAREAAEMLLQRWPDNPPKSHLAARKAVLAALEGYRDQKAVSAAREAFRRAAKDSGILVE